MGKTTALNCLAAAIPGGERVVSAEEVFELRFPQPDFTRRYAPAAGACPVSGRLMDCLEPGQSGAPFKGQMDED